MGESRHRMTRAEKAEAGRKQLRSNSEAVQANPRIISALAAMVSARLGTPVRHLRSEAVPRDHAFLPRMRKWLRAYTKHWFEVAGTIDPGRNLALDPEGRLVVFAKSALNLRVPAELQTLLSDRSGKGFRVPYFFGCFEESGMRVGAFEFIQVGRVQLRDQPWEKQARIIQAIARVNALPPGGTAPPMRQWTPPNWLEPAFQRLTRAGRMEWADLHARTQERLKLQAVFFEKIRSLGATYLTHNDAGVSNLVVPDSGDVIIFDWDNATLGVPGIDLKAIVHASEKERLLRLYVDFMAEYGHRLQPDRVRFAADVASGYWMLRHGWLLRQRWQVTGALDLIEAHLDSIQSPRASLLRRAARSIKQLYRRARASRETAAVSAGSGGATASPAGRTPAPQLADYRDRYGEARCDQLLRLDPSNEASVMSGGVPAVLERLVPLVPGRKVLEVGAGEGIMSLALAAQKERVIGIDMTPVRHEKAREIQSAWRKLGRDVDRCEFVLGDIFQKRELFSGMDTLLACHVIYYFRDRLDEFMALVRDNMKYACLIGNRNRARHYKAGDLRLGGYEYYSTVEGMKDLLQRHGFTITYESDEPTPVVVGERRDAPAAR